MPGTIVRAIRDAESSNPVFLIDEIDKMGADFRGDPASAMLEVLDPEQHSSFRDHYLDLPYDLSKVLFICTANTLDTIPGPLLDRMDVIQLSGYTHEEARDRQALSRPEADRARPEEEQGGDPGPVVAARDRRIHARGRCPEPRPADRDSLPEGCDARRERAYGEDQNRRGARPRLARRAQVLRRRAQANGRSRRRDGLVYTAVGGDVLFIEATAYPGKGRLTITGQLGDVMQESAQAALSWVRSRRGRARSRCGLVRRQRRPRARAGRRRAEGRALGGVTMATTIVSLVRGVPVDDDVGAAGEITLTGQVLPIGGVREKVLAAERAGLGA